MFARFAAAGIAASVALAPATPVMADAGDALVGGVIGGIIGGAIVNESQKKKRTTTTVYRSATPSVSSAQREQNREVQVALNYFGFPVGTPDGVLGRQSRSAISQYQVLLGYPGTGYLSEYERAHLVASYNRAVAGGPMTMQQAAANPMGMRGLLVTWRDEAMGIVPPAGMQPAAPQGQMAMMPVAPVAPAAPAEAPAAPVTETAAAPEAAPAAPGLPTFLGGAGGAKVSLASQCNRVSLMANTAGGYMTVANMTDPGMALGEQFCLVRSAAIAQGEELASRVAGVTPEDIRAQCAGFGPAMKAQVAALSIDPADKVLGDVRQFALGTGMAPDQLAATAKICLSVGYSQDDMDVAIASGLILTALGEGAYGELLGHHLSQGFGAAKRADLAFDWYDKALKSNEQTGTVAFTPGQSDRMQLVRKAAYAIAGRADQAAVPEAVPATLPTFVAPVAPAPAAAPEQSAAAEPAAPVAPTPAAMTSEQVSSLPLAARLPFLLFKN